MSNNQEPEQPWSHAWKSIPSSWTTRSRTVADYLHQSLPDAEVFRLVSAYFTIYGYEALQHELSGIKDVRFLFGDPASVGELDPGGKAPKSFDLSEKGLTPNHELQQKYLAQQCAAMDKKPVGQNPIYQSIEFSARQDVSHRIQRYRRCSSGGEFQLH